MVYNSSMQTKVLITKDQIKRRIAELATELTNDYKGKEVVLIAVMTGSIIFLADLLRALWVAGLTDCEPAFITIKSYGAGTQSSKDPKITHDLDVDITNRHVLIVEDIVDTGYTMQSLVRLLQKRNPASLKILSLLSKPSRREVEIQIDYVGFEIENKWVMGYGFDINNKGRGRPDIEEKIK